jgi:DNA-binding MarR family transcriptional regulator/GNAT superfamily N-acetyltransferase
MNTTIDELRTFNRFFTQSVGALDASFLGTEMSLPEARVLFEIATVERPLASDLQARLGMDPAFLSRVVSRFETRKWITRYRETDDARRRPIVMTDAGRAAFASLDERQRSEVERKLERLGAAQRADLEDALRRVRRLLSADGAADYSIRTYEPGDLGLIASRQAILYREANGWDERLELNVGEAAFGFLKQFLPSREQCWVAEIDGRLAGSIFVTDEGEGLSRLRLLYVEPFARGLGIGNALVGTCVEFARTVGYDRMTLWTHTELESARRIYTAHGFRMVETEIHSRFGPIMQSETWHLDPL